MENQGSDPNIQLVTNLDGVAHSPVKSSDTLTEVILSVPVSNHVIVNIQSVLPVASPVSQISLHRSSCTGPVCRICHEDEAQEELISPCECSGSVALVHSSCIEKWLSSSNTTVCEICKYQFSVNRKPKSLFQWLHNTSSHNGPSGFYGDVVCLVLLTPLCVVSVYLCAIGAKVYINHGLWEGTGLAMLCCFLMGVYVLWCFVTVRFHWKRLRRWQTTNQTVRLVHKFRPDRIKPISAIFASPGSATRGTYLNACAPTPPGSQTRLPFMETHATSTPNSFSARQETCLQPGSMGSPGSGIRSPFLEVPSTPSSRLTCEGTIDPSPGSGRFPESGIAATIGTPGSLPPQESGDAPAAGLQPSCLDPAS